MALFINSRVSKTAALLRVELCGLGVPLTSTLARAKGVVNWRGGTVYRGPLPALNAAIPCNKLVELETLSDTDVPCLTSWTPSTVQCNHRETLLVGRKFHHSQGRDIIGPFRLGNTKRPPKADFYTEVEAFEQEFRVWAWRGEVLASYAKVLRYPDRQRGFGRNYRNGWAFEFVQDAGANVKTAARSAILALGLDFGGVDIGVYADSGDACVIEVNAAPGMQNARVGLRKLAKRIRTWYQALED